MNIDDQQQCPGCPARDGDRCEPGCTCGCCEADVDGDGPRGDEAAAFERDQQIDTYFGLK